MNLDRLTKPRSIAVIGASENVAGTKRIFTSLQTLGYEGAIYPINPKYDTLFGMKCYPSLKDVPTAPDLVSFRVGYQRILENFQMLPEVGAGAAVIYDGGFAESGEEGKKLQDAIMSISREAGIALCGPNCMGVLNPHHRSSSTTQIVSNLEALRGNVGLISHSGSVGIGLVADVRRFGYSLYASTGNEAVVTADQYMNWLIDDPNTKVIAMFMEAVRNPEGFVAALDRAANAGKPVVILKVGRSERTRRAITSHTGGLAGSSKVFSEVIKAHRAIEAFDMDEFTEVLACLQGKTWPKGLGSALITGSGGLAELMLDVATEAGCHLPPISAETRAEAESVIGHIGGDGNPMDAWGHGDFQRNLPHAMACFDKSPDHHAIMLCTETFDQAPFQLAPLGNIPAVAEAGVKSEKPYYVLNSRPGIMHGEQVKYMRERGLVCLGGGRQGLLAIDRVARWNMALPPVRKSAAKPAAVAIGGRATVHEFDSKQMLAACGVTVTKEKLATTLDAAKDAAKSIGYPVVLKAVSDDIPHKSEYGLVKVGIADDAALATAWTELEANMKKVGKPVKLAGFVVQEMIKDGIEMFAGVSRDPDFGLTLAVGFGGIEIEITRDFSLRPLPLREGDAEAMIQELKGVARLGAIRGKPAADIKSFAKAIYGLADFVAANGDQIAEIDLNPIKLMPEGKGCVVVDALIVPKK